MQEIVKNMIKEAKITYLAEAERDELKFWNKKSCEEKLSIVQILREQYIALFNKEEDYVESRKRLRRVYRIIK